VLKNRWWRGDPRGSSAGQSLFNSLLCTFVCLQNEWRYIRFKSLRFGLSCTRPGRPARDEGGILISKRCHIRRYHQQPVNSKMLFLSGTKGFRGPNQYLTDDRKEGHLDQLVGPFLIQIRAAGAWRCLQSFPNNPRTCVYQTVSWNEKRNVQQQSRAVSHVGFQVGQ
jgi:hypothetical protein